MKLKLFKKETWLKKSTWFIMAVFLVTLVGVALPQISNASNTTPGKLDVLEVQPGNMYVLQNNDKINVTQMDMQTFISSAEELSGRYDAIYIGRKNDGLSSKWNVGTAYRDYSSGFSQQWGTLEGNLGNSEDNWRAQVLWYGPSGDVPKDKDGWDWFGQFNSGNFTTTFNNGTTSKMVEYYSENDLTTKKLNEINKFANSGQLVYVDNRIFNDDLKNTKLQKLNNINKISGNLSSETIVNNYSSLAAGSKRAEITMIQGPLGDTGSKGTLANRNLQFKYKVKGKDGVNYKTNLYLDYDGNGLFTEDERVEATTGPLDSTGNLENITTFKLETGFIGYLDWKIEIYNESNSNIKSYVTGNATFKNILEEKIEVNVLQLIPDSACTLNMATSKEFTNEKNSLSDYKINVTAMKISDFNNNCKANSNYYSNNVKGKINMIVIGFADNYGKGIDNQFSEEALKVLKSANEDNLSLLFTHDTMNLAILNNSKTSQNKENDYTTNAFKAAGSRRLTQEFRDIVGQSRYADPFNPNSTITHDNTTLGSGYATLGSTAYASVKLYWDKASSDKVYAVNRSQITDYPFKLGDTISIASTHTQWYQLNLEEEDLVPAYNLKRDGINSGDSRNFYYTYSKGNITYSGAGHSNIDGTDEIRLFINTMIKAIRGANQAPILMNKENTESHSILDDTTKEIYADSDFDFITNISDDSKPEDPIFVTVKTDDGLVLHNNERFPYKRGGIDVSSKLDKEYLEQNAGKTIKITATATDKYGETSEKSFNVKILLGNVLTNHGVYELEYKDNNGNSYPVNRPEDSLTAAEKQISINKWLGEDSISKLLIKNNKSVSYYANVPFIITTTAYSNTVLTLTIDEKLECDGNIIVYEEYKDETGDKLEKLIEVQTKESERSYRVDLTGKINEKTNIVIKYLAKPLEQPEQTTNETEDGLQFSTGEKIEFTNTINLNIDGEDKGNKNATVYVGREVFDKPLF